MHQKHRISAAARARTPRQPQDPDGEKRPADVIGNAAETLPPDRAIHKTMQNKGRVAFSAWRISVVPARPMTDRGGLLLYLIVSESLFETPQLGS